MLALSSVARKKVDCAMRRRVQQGSCCCVVSKTAINSSRCRTAATQMGAGRDGGQVGGGDPPAFPQSLCRSMGAPLLSRWCDP